MMPDRIRCDFDPSAGTLNGTDQVRQTREVLVSDNNPWEIANHWEAVSSTAFSQPVTLGVPGASDGSWTLNLEIVPAGNKLSGTGSIIFSNGEIFEFQLIGSYSPAKQTSKVLLLGSGSAKGARLVLTMVEPEGRITSMRGTVAGQKLLLR